MACPREKRVLFVIAGNMVSKRWPESKGRMSGAGMPRHGRAAADFTWRKIRVVSAAGHHCPKRPALMADKS